MAVSMDFKYFCKICKKGFGCGRALGGHMRAHGIAGEDGGNGDDDDNAGDWEEKNGLSSPAATEAADRRMYTLRANPNRLRSCRVCENCGEEFSSWKSFLEHGRCRYDEEDDGGDGDDEDDDDVGMFVSPAEEVEMGGWSKGKRSRRLFRSSSSNAAAGGNYSGEEVDLANWLVMLSAARVDPAESEESCASANKEDGAGAGSAAAVPRGMFECKGCKKVFSSHQALGGHRASHKKVKGCFAARQDEDVFPGTVNAYPTPSGDGAGASACLQITLQQHTTPQASGKKKSKVHECSICHRVFSSGQALGGHKRCHWVTSNAASSEPASMANLHLHPPLTTTLPPKLDLNMPAPVDELPLLRPQEYDDPFRLEVSASLYLQPWMGSHPSSSINFNSDGSKMNKETTVNTMGSPLGHLDQYSDADSKVKLAKLSELKDIHSGGSSPWLQVGIGTSSTVFDEK